MSVSVKPLTKAELIDYFQVYRNAFPDWAVEHQVVLVRSHALIRQSIAFEALRSGAYRPSCSIHVAGPPDGSQLLFSFLDIKHRDVRRREHDTKWPLMITAMEEQFLPPIRKSLDIEHVLWLSEKEVVQDSVDHINHSTGLAVLNAYVGNAQRALYWCDRVEKRATALGSQLAAWEIRKRLFTSELRRAIEAGKDREYLSRIALQESARFDLGNLELRRD